VRLSGARNARRLAFALALALASCVTLRAPIVTTQIWGTQPGLLRKVAVVPFEPDPRLERSTAPTAVSSAVAAELVARVVAEALAASGSEVVAPNDLVIAFEAAGTPLPRGDARAVAQLAAQHFGASAVVLGRVQRYREREGSSSGTLRPASVAFEMTVYTAPSADRIYVARFDHTQSALSNDLFGSIRYPGGGLRWLSAAELTRWGADHAIKEMPDGLR